MIFRNRLSIAFLSAVIVLSVGCRDKTNGLQFSHDKHAELGIACADCHSTGGTLPTLETCKTCHAEALETVTPQQVEKIMADRDYDSPAYELGFDHARHEGVECADCHKTVNKKMTQPGMDFCMTACHGPQAMAPLTCDKCHRALDPDGRPGTHVAGWKRAHGPTAAADASTCKSCHTEESCFSCHRTAKPENHTQHFRLRGHGVIASADRERCASCHRQDYCTRCHVGTRPINHVSSWSARGTQTHCRNCHLPVSTQTCATCHIYGATHGTAPAWPTNATHVAGATCRTCHAGPGAGLNHPDIGDSCESCHAK